MFLVELEDISSGNTPAASAVKGEEEKADAKGFEIQDDVQASKDEKAAPRSAKVGVKINDQE